MRRYIFLLFGLFFTIFGASAQRAVWNQRYQDYFDTYKDVAIEQMLRYHIPASITLAQGVLESGAGRSDLTRRSNNHFGIKCHGWTGRKSYHDDDARNDCFRVYSNAYESYEDHSKFLAANQRYRSLFNLKTTDYKGWARGLKAAGYATKDQEVGGASLHSIKIFNKNYYMIARRGDTFKSIGEEVGISYRKIAKYNERYRKDKLEEGEIIWLKKKQRKAPKDYKGRLHYVRDGESMYTIAQKYGIRLKNLYKMNHLTPDYQIRVGDGLRLR